MWFARINANIKQISASQSMKLIIFSIFYAFICHIAHNCTVMAIDVCLKPLYYIVICILSPRIVKRKILSIIGIRVFLRIKDSFTDQQSTVRLSERQTLSSAILHFPYFMIELPYLFVRPCWRSNSFALVHQKFGIHSASHTAVPNYTDIYIY